MKRYIRSANRLSNAITERISRKFDENEILVRALVGQHKGSPMIDVFLNIIANPFVTVDDPDRAEGSHTIFYNKKNVGWIDFERGMGWIDDKAYEKMEKLPPEVLRPLADQFREGLSEEAGARGLLGPAAQRDALAKREERARALENMYNDLDNKDDLMIEEEYGDDFWED